MFATLPNHSLNGGQESAHEKKALMANPSMSRRTFFKASAISGALAFVGSALFSSGLRLDAFADETGKLSFSVYVLSNREVPFYSFDSVTHKAIPHVAVEMSVTYNGKTQVFKFETDDTGFYAWNMDQMASAKLVGEASGSSGSAAQANAEIYNETARRAVQMPAVISYKKDGYRAVKYDVDLRCDTAPNSEGKRTNVVNLASHPISAEEQKGYPVYLKSLSLDGVDIQYTAQEAYIHEQNDMTHTIRVEIAGPKAGVRAGASIVIENRYRDIIKNYGEIWSTTSGSDPAVATVEFKQQFLREIPVGSTMVVYFAYSSKVLTYKVPLTFVQDMSPDMSGQLGYVASPGLQKATGNSDNRPEVNLGTAGWTLPPYDSLKCALPMLPITLFFDHKGNFGAVAKISSNIFIKRRNGKELSRFGEHKWFGGKTTSAAFDDYCKELSDSLKNYNSSKMNARSNNRAFGKGKMSSKLDVSFDVSIMGVGSITTGKNSQGTSSKDYIWTMDAGFEVEIKVNGSVNLPFTVGFVPFFVNFTFLASGKCQLLFGMQFRNAFEDINWHHHTPSGGGPGALVVIMFDIGAEIGVGIDGIAAIGVFGHGYIKAIMHFDYKEGKSYPRRQVFVGCGFGAYAQLLFFKKKWTLKSFPPKMIGDSWNSNNASSLSSIDATSILSSAGGHDMSDGEPITQEDLFNSTEYRVPEGSESVLSWAELNQTEGSAEQGKALESVVQSQAVGTDTDSLDNEASTKNQANNYEQSQINTATTQADDAVVQGETNSVSAQALADDASAQTQTDGDDTQTQLDNATSQEDVSSQNTSSQSNAAVPLAIQLERINRAEGTSAAQLSSLEDATDTIGIQNPYGDKPYNPLDGLKPTSQIKIKTRIYNGMLLRSIGAHNAFNTTDGSFTNEMPLVIGRIGTVETYGIASTRLFINVWNKDDQALGNEHIIDFDYEGWVTGLKSSERLDVDFSFDTFVGQSERQGSTPHTLVLIAITSIPKSKQNASFEEQKASQFITVLVYDATYYQGKYESGTLIIVPDCRTIKPEGAAVFHPRVLIHAHPDQHSQVSAGNSYKASQSVLYYKQTTGKSDAVIAISTYNVSFVPSSYAGQPDCPTLSPRISDLSLDIQAPVKATDLIDGTFEVSPGPSYYPISIAGSYYSPVVIGWSGHDSIKTSTEDSSQSAPASFVVSLGLAYEGSSHQARVGVLNLPGVNSLALRVAGKSNTPFVYADQTSALNAKELTLIYVNSDDLAISKVSAVGQTAFTNFFSDGTGDRLYTVNVIEGDTALLQENERVMQTALDDDSLEFIKNGAAFYSNAYSDSFGYDNNGYQKSTESAYIHRYQILESRFLAKEGTYSEFYPVAQLDFCPQHVAYCPQYVSPDISSENRTFLVSTTTDFDALTADLYQVTIPTKLVLHVSAAKGISNFAANGDRVWYELSVVNMGNEPITGFTAEVYGASKSGGNKKLIAQETFKQLRSYATDSSDCCRCKLDANGNPIIGSGGNYETTMSANIFDQLGILMPGMARTYLLYFTMATDFHGWSDFSVKAIDAISSFDDLAVEPQSNLSSTVAESDDSDDDDDDDYDFTDDYDTTEEFEKATNDSYADYVKAYSLFTKDYFVGDISKESEINAWFNDAPSVEVNDDHDYDLDYDDITFDQIVDYADAVEANYEESTEEAMKGENNHSQNEEANGAGLAASTGDSMVDGLAVAAVAGAVTAAAAAAKKLKSDNDETAIGDGE